MTAVLNSAYYPALGFLDGLRPEPRLTVSEWADAYRELSTKASAEAGKWRTDRAPYLRKIMDSLSAYSTIQEVIIKKGAQLGLTEAGFNWMGYIIDISPAATLIVMPTDAMVKKNSKMRFDPMITATPRLKKKIKSNREKDSGNTINQKDFPGGTAVLVGANSPVGLRSMPAKNVLLDEVDAYPLDVDGEGSPIDLAKARTRTYPRRKIMCISTPTVKGKSTISKEFEDTDQQYFHIPFPCCGEYQHLEWENIIYTPGEYENVKCRCKTCGQLHAEHVIKSLMLVHGTWIALNPNHPNKTRIGFHINSLYSPMGWYGWGEAAADYEKALKDVTKMKAFVNTVLGLEYEEESDAPAWEQLYDRREQYPQDKPKKNVAFLTAGVDVQKDRIEVEVVGWMAGKKSQSICYRVFVGKTEEKDVWKQLGAMLNEQWEREDGALMPITVMAVDSGYNTSYVHEFVRAYDPSRVIATKGQDKSSVMVSAPRQVDVTKSGEKVGQAKQWNIGVSMIKSEIYGWLKLRPNEDGTLPDGHCCFPQYDSHYFRGLTAEAVEMVINKKGYREYKWVKKYERNEPLDCRVYARAAASVYGLDRFKEQNFADLVGGYTQKSLDKLEKSRKKSSFWGEKD